MQADMLVRGKEEGWNAQSAVNEFMRLGGHNQDMLQVDFLMALCKADYYPSQSVREGKASSIFGIFFNVVDAGYTNYSGGRDLQYDVTHLIDFNGIKQSWWDNHWSDFNRWTYSINHWGH